MCGFAAIVDPGHSLISASTSIDKMLNTIRHRGPDDEGQYCSEEDGVFLGHRRLAIIDPEHGKQPMISSDERLVIVFNGVIYNYLELRRELVGKGHPVKSYSDTEVLLYAYREWGKECLQRLEGMFAFAIWDKQARRIFCARDRIGIKPFYYSFDGNTFACASEIKALLASGLVKAHANLEGIRDYLTFQFGLSEKTLFEGVLKLEPGHCMLVQLRGDRIDVRVEKYWDLHYEIDDSHDEEWFVGHLAGLIEDATRMHLRSDVPLGAHLSGGLDSSTIVCLAADMLRGERIKTFTGAFPEGPQFDETEYARAVSDFAHTDQQEIYIQGEELSEILPRLIYYMDEPQAGPGVIPQYYVSDLAAQHVKVVLGGQGGDELFIGYARHLVTYLESCLSGAIFETADKDRYAVTLESIIPNLPVLQGYRPMMQSLWKDGLFDSPDKRYFRLVDRSESTAHLLNPDLQQLDYSPFEEFSKIFNREGLNSLVNQMTYFDLKGSLPALLQVEDRTSMAVSLESRVPLLDHRIVEFMARVPPNVKFSGGRMKHLFKEAVRNTVPQKIFERKDKKGFPTPLAQWINGSAKEFVFDTLLSKRARERGLFDAQAVEKALNSEHEFGRVVWGLLCLELWYCIFIDGEVPAHVGK